MFFLHVLDDRSNRLVLSADNVYPLIVLQTRGNVVQNPGHTTGLYHLALLVPSRNDLPYVVAHLIQKGIRFDGASDYLFSEAMVFLFLIQIICAYLDIYFRLPLIQDTLIKTY
jgi:catechol 2,3-dioxygenase